MEKWNKKEIIIYLVPIFIAIVSLIISLRSCSVAENSIEISRKSYELNLEPILDIDLLSNIGERKYALKFINDGPIPIIDFIVNKEINFYAEKGMSFQGEKIVGKPWLKREIFKSGDTLSKKIDFKDLEALWLGYTNKQLVNNDDKTIRTLLFKISFRKQPELKQYRIRKFIFVEPIIYFKDTTIYAFDPEKTDMQGYKAKLKVVEAREEQRGWEN